MPAFAALTLPFIAALLAGACSSTSSERTTATDPSQPPPECLARSAPAAVDGGASPEGDVIRCAGEADCPQGYRCNTAMAPPACEKLYCGTAQSVCSSQELCQQGMECFDGRCTVCNVCGDRCAVDFDSDPANCGSCGNVVPKDRTCVSGVPTCKPPLVECGGACVDTKTSARHCGGCDQPVPASSECRGGAPACVSGFLSCKKVCVDPTQDDRNCTACGRTCPSNRSCTGLGGGGCLGKITTSTPAGVDCNFLCSLGHEKCVDGVPFAIATYQGSPTTKPALCNTPPPQSVTENGMTVPIVAMACACIVPPN